MSVATQTRAQNTEVARARREQIIEAAVAIITAQGLHSLSLSKIEAQTGMKRGQLTYYYATKEEILLAVFDRMLLLVHQQLTSPQQPDERRGIPPMADFMQQLLQLILQPGDLNKEFHTLQYTFLAQIAFREDFRAKLADVYGEWRNTMGAHWHVTMPDEGLKQRYSGRTVASFLQALLHGLTLQLAADPNAFDRQEMLKLCIESLIPLIPKLAEHASPVGE
ncbi:MAG: TetR/AcrR family transcriptional regulator [Zavarzinella sp.]